VPLVTEVAGLTPGRVLDVGCGEGADAVWLASHGWHVTALDVSRVALERARRAAVDAGVAVQWVCAGLLDAPLPTDGYDLVSVQYPALYRTAGGDAERILRKHRRTPLPGRPPQPAELQRTHDLTRARTGPVHAADRTCSATLLR